MRWLACELWFDCSLEASSRPGGNTIENNEISEDNGGHEAQLTMAAARVMIDGDNNLYIDHNEESWKGGRLHARPHIGKRLATVSLRVSTVSAHHLQCGCLQIIRIRFDLE